MPRVHDGHPTVSQADHLRFLLILVALMVQPAVISAGFHSISLPAGNEAKSELPTGLPVGRIVSAQVPFEAGTPVRLTGLDDARQGRFHPPSVNGLPVGRKFGVLHLLHGIDGTERDGTPVASILLRYADGQQDVVRLAYGLQARSLAPARDERSSALHDPNSRIGWPATAPEGARAPAQRLYHSALANPRPDETVISVDIVSLFSRATPFIVAITAEDGTSVTPSREMPENRVVRRSRALTDDAYHDTFHLQARDSNGQPVIDAEATLTISDLEGSYFFGKARADAEGRIRLGFPPQQAAGCTVLVRTPGRLPFVFRNSGTGIAPAERTIVATLESGTTVGGVVRSAAGEPLAGATVTMYHLQAVSSREYERLDYDSVTTDVSGNWSSTALPQALEQVHLVVGHVDFRPRTFRVGPRDPSLASSVLVPAELRAKQAVAILEPAQRIAGVVHGPEGQPVAGAEVRLSSGRNSSSADANDEQVTRSDAAGRFKFSVQSSGSYGLVVLASGYTPDLRNISMPNRAGAIVNQDISLTAGRHFTGRVLDQNRQPIAGARVRLESWNDSRLLKFEAETDSAGAFVWTNAPDGQLRFFLSATNHSSTTYSISGNTSEHQFTLRKFSSVRGLVTDAATGQPIPDFMIFRGRAYNQGEPIRWERYNTFRGRNGDYNVRLVEYSSGTRTAILVEAPGYLPAASPEFTRAGLYTNHFALKKTRGVFGKIVDAGGAPAVGATANLVEPSEYAYFRANGDVMRNSDSGPQVRSDRNGEFQFPARLAPHTIIATHERGFAEVRVTNPEAPVTITLQPWAEISGIVKFPARSDQPHLVHLGNAHHRYADDSRESQPLSLYVSVEADPDGRFRFNRVPPGDRSVALRHSIQVGDSTRTINSHQYPVTLAPGAATNIVLGENGRSLVGRMKVLGGEPEDVDWRRDFHTLSLRRVLDMKIAPLDFSEAKTDEQRQALWAEQRKLEAAYWRTPAGRSWERSERTYALQFNTNGTFRVDGVPPGQYSLNVSPTDPTREDYSYDHIGNITRDVMVPEPGPNDPGKAIDLGEIEITIRATLRIGKRAPRVQVTGFDGKEVSLEQLRGKPVLLDFWATWHGSRTSDLRQLKLIHDRFGQNKQLHMLAINFDAVRAQGEAAAKTSAAPWTQAYGGDWNESPLRQALGLRSLPDCLLIDAEGRIAGLNLRGTAVTRAVERLLSNAMPARAP